MAEFRLGDDIDDFCVKCRRLTNHSIVSLMGTQPAKMRCRTCYHEHDFRNGEAPPKKDTKKEALFKQVLATVDPSAVAIEAVEETKKPKAKGKKA
ncbi:MAG TPA: hypothetical protein VN893_15960 [Bryobacteraceae bacterium]|nr:hypothetical protein [Bryobacteraceae bacterium]